MMIIDDVASRLHPGKEPGVNEQNEAAAVISDSTYQLIDDLSKAIEADIKAARQNQYSTPN